MATFAFFNCEPFDDDSAYLRIDYSTECYTTKWNFYLIYALAMLLVFPVGIPLYYYAFLWTHRHAIDPVVPSTGKRGRMTEDKEVPLLTAS